MKVSALYTFVCLLTVAGITFGYCELAHAALLKGCRKVKFAVIAVSALIAIAACAWGVETSHTFLKQATCSAEAPVIAESLVEALNGPSGGTLTLLPYDGSDVDMQLIATDNEGDD